MKIKNTAVPVFKVFVLISALLTCSLHCSFAVAQSAVDTSAVGSGNLDHSLKPQATDEVSSLFENIVAVQKKARVKSGKFLFSPSMSFDFSDSPNTMYGLNLDFGYALGEFWEVYLAVTPTYISNERSLAKKVRDLNLGSQEANIVAEKAKYSYGIDVNWVPIYGKDSWGPYGIIRSDTFINFGLKQVKYEVSTGNQFKTMLGKTFFISNYFNLRLQAGASYLETFSVNGKKDGIILGLLEGGVVFYF